MVGVGAMRRSFSLEEVLSAKQLDLVLRQLAPGDYEVAESVARPVSEGIAGFLGDHFKIYLRLKVGDDTQIVHLFVKRLPQGNQPKGDFIESLGYFKREKLVFDLMKELKVNEGSNPWGVDCYLCTDSLLVMKDLTVSRYIGRPQLEVLDLAHVLLVTASIALFHAAFASYETNKTIDVSQPYNFYERYSHVLQEPSFTDTPWLWTAAKLTADFLHAFSAKYTKKIPNLEANLGQAFLEASKSLTVVEDTLNVLIHKDLWVNNILFKYEEGKPSNAILIDFQCIRYAPPAFDLMVFLYLTTDRSLREKHESRIFRYYYQIFSECIDERTRKRLELHGFDEGHFLKWCDRARMFGMVEALAIYPQVLMDPQTAEKVFDDPETFMRVMEEDRSPPVVEYARSCRPYRERQLEISEEFVDRYVLRLY